VIPEYYELLREALNASHDVDHFDLHSEDPASVTAYKVLKDTSEDAQKALCYLIRKNKSLFRYDGEESYSIYLIKATRKPVFVRHISGVLAEAYMDELAGSISILQGANLASSGVSIQLVEKIHDDAIAKIEIGGLAFYGIPVDFQYNGF
jgi:hypothetical protein